MWLLQELVARYNLTKRKPAPSKPTDPTLLLGKLQDGTGLPVFKNGRKLRSYQEESFRWMVAHLLKGENAILGDEMGLGKTAQVCPSLHKANSRWPFA